MPLGPLQLVDETSIDLGVKIAKATKAAMGDAYPDGAVDEVLFWMADQGRLGRKSKAGFYAYDDAGKRQGSVARASAERYPLRRDPARADRGAAPAAVRAGAGGGAGAGGRRADRHPRRRCRRHPRLGLRALVGRSVQLARHHRRRAGRWSSATQLAARHGARFAAPELLREMAAKGESFYGRFAPQAATAA